MSRRTDHLLALAKEMGVFVWVCLNSPVEPNGRADNGGHDKLIYLTASPDKPWAYWIAMHELGHIAHGWGKRPFLTEEVLAWRWALEHAKEPLRREHAEAMLAAIESYGESRWSTGRRKYTHTPEYLSLLAELEARA